MKRYFWIILSILLALLAGFFLLYWYTDGAILNKDGNAGQNGNDILNNRFFAGHSEDYWADRLLDVYEKKNGFRPSSYSFSFNVNKNLEMTFYSEGGSVLDTYTVNKHTKYVKDSNNMVVDP